MRLTWLRDTNPAPWQTLRPLLAPVQLLALISLEYKPASMHYWFSYKKDQEYQNGQLPKQL